MSFYNPKIKYKGHYNTDFGLITATFDPDTDTTENYLDLDPVYTENFDGSYRYDYGAKFNNIVTQTVTFIKNNGADFRTSEVRAVVKWLSGSRQASWLDLYDFDGNHLCSFLGRFISVNLRKMDARVIGIVAEFASVSPWAYSPIQEASIISTRVDTLNVYVECDDDDSIIYPDVVIKSTTENGTVQIQNFSTGETLELTGLAESEIVTLSSGQIIESSIEDKIFGDTFNYKWLRFINGQNPLLITGKCEIKIQYRNILKTTNLSGDMDGVHNALSNSYGFVAKYSPVDAEIILEGNTAMVSYEDQTIILNAPLLNAKL